MRGRFGAPHLPGSSVLTPQPPSRRVAGAELTRSTCVPGRPGFLINSGGDTCGSAAPLRRGLDLGSDAPLNRRNCSHAYERVLGDRHDTVLRALSKRRSQTRLSDITVPYGKPHRSAVEPQNEVLANLHQSHRSGRRKRDSAQATPAVSRPASFMSPASSSRSSVRRSRRAQDRRRSSSRDDAEGAVMGPTGCISFVVRGRCRT